MQINKIKDVSHQGSKLKTELVKIVLNKGAKPYAVNQVIYLLLFCPR